MKQSILSLIAFVLITNACTKKTVETTNIPNLCKQYTLTMERTLADGTKGNPQKSVFQFDDKNRCISAIENDSLKTFFYFDDINSKAYRTYIINNDTVINKTYYATLNSNGYISYYNIDTTNQLLYDAENHLIQYGEDVYTWKDGNLVSIHTPNNDYTFEYDLSQNNTLLNYEHGKTTKNVLKSSVHKSYNSPGGNLRQWDEDTYSYVYDSNGKIVSYKRIKNIVYHAQGIPTGLYLTDINKISNYYKCP